MFCHIRQHTGSEIWCGFLQYHTSGVKWYHMVALIGVSCGLTMLAPSHVLLTTCILWRNVCMQILCPVFQPPVSSLLTCSSDSGKMMKSEVPGTDSSFRWQSSRVSGRWVCWIFGDCWKTCSFQTKACTSQFLLLTMIGHEGPSWQLCVRG